MNIPAERVTPTVGAIQREFKSYGGVVSLRNYKNKCILTEGVGGGGVDGNNPFDCGNSRRSWKKDCKYYKENLLFWQAFSLAKIFFNLAAVVFHCAFEKPFLDNN